VTVTAVVGLALVGCASGASTAGSTGATGTPIKIGLINQQAGSGASVPEYADGITAAVDYINEEMHGLDGHPLQLIPCVTDGTPATSQSCAQQMVEAKPAFVTTGLDNNMAVVDPILKAAGIAVLGGSPVAPTDYAADDARYFQGGGLTLVIGIADLIKQTSNGKVKNVGIIALNPSGVGAATLIKPHLNDMGISSEQVVVAPDATDMLSPLQSLTSQGADEIIAFTTSQQCVALMKARQQQKSTIPVVTPTGCYTKKLLDQAGSAMEGLIVSQYGPDLNGTSKDAVTYRDAMHKYIGANANIGAYSADGFSATMTIYENILKSLGAKGLNTKAILAKADDPAGGSQFLGPDYKCGQIPTFGAICNFKSRWYVITDAKTGAIKDATNGQYVDAAPLLQK
jgi:branched-chain amino acid transport system substrate-binding protein